MTYTCLSMFVNIYTCLYIYKPTNLVIPTPTYKLAKKLNDLIKPYIPSDYSLKSTDDFIDLLRSTRPDGLIASLDVESLFTNVPAETTIEIILKNVYEHPTLPRLDLPRHILANLLRSCTSEALFKSHDGKLYLPLLLLQYILKE